MAEVLISWIFIGITSYVTGFEICSLLTGMLTDRRQVKTAAASGDDAFIIRLKVLSHPNVLICLVGLCAVNVYAQIISLFTGVGMWADYILMFLSLVMVYADRSRIGKALDIGHEVGARPVKSFIYVILVLLMAYGTSRGYMHFDTNLYHAQAIRWVEEFGVTPGLANIQSRFGYNSSIFTLNALYGFKWYLGRSLHTSAGFFALLSSFVAAGICNSGNPVDLGRGMSERIRISDYVRLGLIFYLGLIYAEMVSPASDYYAQLLLFDVVIIWLDIADETDEDLKVAYYGILCLLLVYSVTIKLSLAPLVLLAFIPGVHMIRQKDIRSILICIAAGLAIALPYFIRGYIISGWILYPSVLVSLGAPDWRIPKGMVQYDAREIGMWGRGITRAEDWDRVTAFNWLPGYIEALSPMEKLWLAGSIVSAVYILILAIRSLKTGRDKRLITLMGVLCVGLIVWFVKAPLIRYGYVYIILVPTVTLGYVMRRICIIGKSSTGKKLRIVPFITLALLIGGLKAKGLIYDIMRTADEPYYVNQQDYIDGDAFEYTVDDSVFYVAEDSGQIGYYKFPSTVEERHDFGLRGDDISDGFYHID